MKGLIEWNCPTNIALVKYWGKKGGQIPVNPSLSVTLSESATILSLHYKYDPKEKFQIKFMFDGKRNSAFSKRIVDYLKNITSIMPVLQNVNLIINSTNTFPHSAGIASSASSFGALALALCSMESEITGAHTGKKTFFEKASYLARLGSGSACRSVYGNYVLWGQYGGMPGSSDETAVPVSNINPRFRYLRNSILVVSGEKKKIPSSKGHELMNSNPYATARQAAALINLKSILGALNSGNFTDFISVMENEALTLHALMMTSSPGYMLMLPATVEIINKIVKFRGESGLPVGFTLDAGPNVHFIYPRSVENEVCKFIIENLTMHCENGTVIHDHIGNGPVRIK